MGFYNSKCRFKKGDADCKKGNVAFKREHHYEPAQEMSVSRAEPCFLTHFRGKIAEKASFTPSNRYGIACAARLRVSNWDWYPETGQMSVKDEENMGFWWKTLENGRKCITFQRAQNAARGKGRAKAAKMVSEHRFRGDFTRNSAIWPNRRKMMASTMLDPSRPNGPKKH